MTGTPLTIHVLQEAQRERLVRVCAALTGDRDAAEDLAQETLLEAWRNVHKLHDPDGTDRWLAAIARNVCLRWARRRGRDGALLARVDAAASRADELDVEIELERAELAELLDRALALLPPVTRDVLVHRYVHQTPHAEIATRLGLSEDAVSMRVSRGKVVLRRVLSSQLGDDAAAFGVTETTNEWQETRVWCAECGRRRLVVRRDRSPRAVSFRCPGCNPDAPGAVFAMDNPALAELVGDLVRPTAILARAAEWSSRYYAGGVGPVPCTRCGRRAAVKRYYTNRDGWRRDGLYADCGACGQQLSSSVNGLASSLPDVRRFRREHARTQSLPAREVERGGIATLVVRYEDIAGSAGVDVLVERDTLRVLEVHGAPA